MSRVIGRHYVDGSCDPRKFPSMFKTFSVAVFEWIAAKGTTTGGKCGPAKVRVSGRCADAEAVYACASGVALALDLGNYNGPKFVRVKCNG